MNITTYEFTPALSVRTVLRNGEPWFVAADVCAALGLRNTTQAVADHVHADDKSIQSIGLPGRDPLIVNESGMYALIFGSRKEDAQRFKRWVTSEVLPSIRKTGSYVAQPAASLNLTHSYTDAVAGAEVVARMLRLEGSAALGMVRKATELTAPHLLPMLPAYAVDAPPSELATRGSSRPTTSMLAILRSVCAEWPGKKPGTRMVNNVYAALQTAGILEQRTRASTSNPAGVKQFWSITDKGLEFGKNVTSEKNQRETAPHWYTDTAGKLLDIAIDTARNN